jgi:hypothetical protein
MIVLDTDVFSASMDDEPDSRLVARLDGQPSDSIHITAITVYEVRRGIELLAPGARRRRLDQAFDRALARGLSRRILPLDASGAEGAAILSVQRQKAGRPGDLRDTLIAGIAISRGATIATRNTRHFRDLPINVVDPWG